MEKSRANAGFTMVELLVSVVLMVFLALGMGVGMNSGSNVYRHATFETDSALLAETLNNTLGDVLRHGQDFRKNNNSFQDSKGEILSNYEVPFVFTNLEYGVQDGYLCLSPMDQDMNVFLLRSLKNTSQRELVTSGAYANLIVTDLHMTYVSAEEDTGGNTGYVEVSYVIQSKNKTMSKPISTVIRLMN